MKNLKKIHKILLFVGIFVTIIVAKSQVEEVYANNSVVCNPVLIRKCSICGNNYDNSEECPHHVNEMYHGDICSPTPGRICNICGGNYDDGTICHHHNGEYYNGEICSPTRICDICGGNYDDGNECPHHEGESYGGEECTIEWVEICNICGNDYNDGTQCNHLKNNFYDEWCEPKDTRICSICGNDYDCAGLCPHHEGEIYNEEICTITRRCNICGGNYDDGNECPHHQGEEYGGKECDAYEGRLCNICGYNYDDGSVCPHKSGQRYNGDICYILETRLCNICGKNYDNPNECPHKIGTIYEDIIYIFYISASRNVADIQKTMLSNYYGLSQENIVLKEICSQQDYINAWNEMGLYNGQLYNVLLVNITMHGGALWMGEQNGTQYVTPYVIKWKLESKKVERVLLVSCDVGNVDYSTTNIAANIAKKTEGGTVIASDGTVQFSTPGFGSPYYYSSVYDSYFYNECVNKGRDNRGWLLYRYENERIEISAGKGKKLKIEQILGAVA